MRGKETLVLCWGECKLVQLLWKNSMEFPQKIRNRTAVCLVAQLCLTLYDPMDCNPPGSSVHGDSPGKNTGVGSHALLHGIFPIQESNPGLLHCEQILYCLSPPELPSVQFNRSVVSDSLRPHESQHTRPPCPSPTPGVHPNSCPSSQWCHPAISSSVVPFSSCSQIPPSISLFQWVNSSHEVAKVLEFKFQHQSFQWTPRADLLGWTVWTSLQSKGLSIVFSNTTVQKHQFFGTQLSYGPPLTSIYDKHE